MIELRYARKLSGFKTSFICQKMGISLSYLYDMEKNRKPVPDERKQQFINLYQIKDIKF
jgi:transcriptional regulator with XRE-family HTH domain